MRYTPTQMRSLHAPALPRRTAHRLLSFVRACVALPTACSRVRALEGKSFFYDTTLPPKPAEAPGAVKQEQEPLAAPPAPPKSSLPLKKRTSE